MMKVTNLTVWLALCLSVALSALSGCGRSTLPGPAANAEMAKTIRDALKTASPESTAGAAAPTGTGWATLRGRFIYDGTPPQMQPYNVTKDFEACTNNGQAPPQETLVVQDSSHGILHVAIYLRRASRVHESLTQNLQPVIFDQKTCVFLPHVLATQVGQTVSFKNSDPVGHNIKFVGFNETIASGTTRDYSAPKEVATPLQVSCSIHPWMQGYFLARDNPYFALTKEDGAFELANLPAGEELEFQVWHESATGAGGGLPVASTPETKAMGWSNRGRFKIKLNQDEVKEIQITVPSSSFKGT